MRYLTAFFLLLGLSGFCQEKTAEDFPSVRLRLAEFMADKRNKADSTLVTCICFDEKGSMVRYDTSDSLDAIHYCEVVLRDDFGDEYDYRNPYSDPAKNKLLETYYRKDNDHWFKLNIQNQDTLKESFMLTDEAVLKDTMYVEHHLPPYDIFVAFRTYYRLKRKN